MCRHLAYLGPPVALHGLLLDPPFGLLRQSWAPRRQRNGLLNADGFGVGWYAPDDPVPARYRRDRPMWTDANLPELARVVRSGAVLAAVRSGTDGMGHAESAAAPFRDGRWLFSHNGAMPGWPSCAAGLAATLPPERLLHLDASSDSALLWALTHARVDAGAPLADALATTVAAAAEAAPATRSPPRPGATPCAGGPTAAGSSSRQNHPTTSRAGTTYPTAACSPPRPTACA